MYNQEEYITRLIDEARKIVKQEEADLNSLNKLLSRKSLIDIAQWHDDKPYTRICLYEDTEFELILICWKALSKTAVHNHNEQNCWVFFFDSDFQEVIYCQEGKKTRDIKKVNKGGISYMKDKNKCHSLHNLSDAPVMTLHLYNAPIKSCEILNHNDNNNCLGWADLKYDVKLDYEMCTS